MAFYNVSVKRVRQFLILVEADDAVSAEQKAKQRVKNSEVTEYREVLTSKSILVDPDAIV